VVALLTLTWDAWLAIVLSIGAFLFGLGGFVFGVRADRRATRAEEMARAAEARDQERLERERQDAAAAGRARLAVRPMRSEPPADADQRVVPYSIRNYGEATAYWVRVWLADEDETDMSIQAPTPFTLEPGEQDDRHPVIMPLGIESKRLHFVVKYEDSSGHYTQPTNQPPIY
jgi:hypothetical protein